MSAAYGRHAATGLKFEPPTLSCHPDPEGLCLRNVTGFDRRIGAFPEPIAEQCRLAFSAGAASLTKNGSSLEDVVRVVYLVKNPDEFPSCFPFLRNAFGEGRPASTLRVVHDFDRPGMEIEIELIARMSVRTDN